MYMFHAFWQFRNCIAHSVSCQIACWFLNCVHDFEIVQWVYTAQFRNRCFWARYAPVLDGKLLIRALYSRFQLASCSYHTHTPLNVIIALRWTPRVLNTKLKCWFLQQCHDGRGSLALISMNINLFVETGVRSSTSNPRGYRLENPRPWCYVP